MRKLLLVIALLFTGLLASGCTTLVDAQAARGSGTVRVYDESYDTAYNAVLATVREAGLGIVSEDRARGQILAQGSMNLLSYGENVAIFVERQGQRSTRVEVVNKRAMAVNITAANWEARLIEALDRRMRR